MKAEAFYCKLESIAVALLLHLKTTTVATVTTDLVVLVDVLFVLEENLFVQALVDNVPAERDHGGPQRFDEHSDGSIGCLWLPGCLGWK